MAGVTAQGAVFSFIGFTGSVTGLSIESPVAEIADMTGIGDASTTMRMQPTGAWSGGGVSVDFIAARGASPEQLVRQRGPLIFSSPNFSYAVYVILESVSLAVQSGDVIRGTMKFKRTDYA